MSSSDLALDVRAIFHCHRCAANALPEEEVLLWVEERHAWRWVMWCEAPRGPKVLEWNENTKDWHLAESGLVRKYQLGDANGQVSCCRCWNEWNWYVKQGERKYMLDSECESLLEKFGVLNVIINEVEPDAPFFCRLCLLNFSKCNLKPHISRHLASSAHQDGCTQTDPIDPVVQTPSAREPNMLWEFQGNHGQWQPFEDDVQCELEEGYLQAQTGGEPRLVIFTNNYRYIIDFEQMTQRNPATNTTRHVRRKNVLEVRVGELENQILNMQQEQAELVRSMQELEKENHALRSQPSNNVVRPDLKFFEEKHSLLEMWKTERQFIEFLSCEISKDDPFFTTCQTLLRQAVPVDHIGQCAWMRTVKVKSIHQIHNVKLWSNYQHRKRQLQRDLPAGVIPKVASRLGPCCPWASLDGPNEVIALHGTFPENIQSIVESGFDYRLARDDGLYGQGLYFSDESCKCLQYSRALEAHGAVGCIIVTRLLLGDAYLTTGPRFGERIEPLRDPSNPGSGRFNSVIACAGIVGNAGLRQVHPEFVVYDGAQAYPELVVCFHL